MTHGNGLVRTVGYDLQYRVTSLQTGALQDLTYIPDPNGNVQDIVDNLDPNKNKSYSYDSVNRLGGATGPWGTLSWTYDDVGNRLTYTDGSGTTNYSYFTDTNRLQDLTGATSKTFSYTNTGNTETEDTRQYIYNENNRLTQVSDGGVIGDYAFNGYGERVIKSVQGTTTIFNYDKDGNLIAESDGVNSQEYIYLGSAPIAKASGNDLFFIHRDHLDTPQVMTNAGGASVWDIDVRPFGDRETMTGMATLNLRFPGQYYDDETGLNYNYFRSYDPIVGRYLEADPIGLLGGINPYVYVMSDPINYFDLRGLVKVSQHIKITPTNDPEMKDCGKPAGGACIPTYWASMTWECVEECPGKWQPENVTLHIGARIYVYGRHFSTLENQPNDKTVTDRESALDHETGQHIVPSANHVLPMAEDYERQSFGSEELCDEQGRKVNKDIGTKFRGHMKKTQADEEAKYKK
jgi:RHS repeat-associated protein